MIYYRVALMTKDTPTWKWKSTVLTSLDALFGYLKTFQAVPKDQMRVFLSSSAQQGWDEMLTRQNNGMLSNSLSAQQVLNGCRICPLEVMKLELELRADGDYDIPYEFTPPTSMKQKLAWAKLLRLVSTGELQP